MSRKRLPPGARRLSVRCCGAWHAIRLPALPADGKLRTERVLERHRAVLEAHPPGDLRAEEAAARLGGTDCGCVVVLRWVTERTGRPFVTALDYQKLRRAVRAHNAHAAAREKRREDGKT